MFNDSPRFSRKSGVNFMILNWCRRRRLRHPVHNEYQSRRVREVVLIKIGQGAGKQEHIAGANRKGSQYEFSPE